MAIRTAQHHRRRQATGRCPLGSLCVGLLVALALLAPRPAPARSFIERMFGMSTDQEIKVGREAARQVERKLRVLYLPEVANYIDDIGQRLVRHSLRANLRYRFKVVKKRDINAFALPGGYVYVNLGLIGAADAEMEVAGVLAHEIGHISAHHHSQQMAKSQAFGIGSTIFGAVLGATTGRIDMVATATQLAQAAAVMKFSRDAEREADRLGVQMLYRAGWDPRGMVTFFEKLQRERNKRGGVSRDIDIFFASHPTPQERRENVDVMLTEFPSDPALVRDTPQFQRVRDIVRRMLDPSLRRPRTPRSKLPPFLKPRRRAR